MRQSFKITAYVNWYDDSYEILLQSLLVADFFQSAPAC
jgi:hypothetical protein